MVIAFKARISTKDIDAIYALDELIHTALVDNGVDIAKR